MSKYINIVIEYASITVNLLIGGIVALVTWGPRAVLNRWFGRTGDICDWLDEHFPI